MVRPVNERGPLTRMNIYLAERQIATLHKIAEREKTSAAELIRLAIDALIAVKKK
jgi:hypothetical protein